MTTARSTSAGRTQELAAAERYPRTLQVLHWAIAALVSAQFAIILVLKQLQALQFGQVVLGLHRQCGALILVLVLVKLALSVRLRAPKSPFRFPAWQAAAAHLTHYALLAILVAQPVLGALTAWARGDEVTFLFLIKIPKLVTLSNEQGVALGAWHGRIAIAMLALVGLHIAAVVFNRVARKAAVIERMMPATADNRLVNRVPILAQLAFCCGVILALTLGAGLYGAAQYRSFNEMRTKFDETEASALDDMRAAQLAVKTLATQAADGQPAAALSAKAAEAAATVGAFPSRLKDAGARSAAQASAAALQAAAAGDASKLAQADTQLQSAVDSQFMAVFQKRLDIGETASKGHDMIVLALAPTVMLSALVALLLSRSILAALKRARLVVRRIEEDDDEQEVKVEGAGEFALLMREILQMRDSVNARQRESHARELEKQAELDRLAREQQQRDAEAARRAAAEQAEIVGELARGMSSLAAGRFDFQIRSEFAGEFDRIRVDFNEAVAKLGEVMGAVSKASKSVGTGSHGIAQATRELSARTDDQAARLEETAAALGDVTDTVRKSAAGARQAAEVVVSARSEADQSETVLEEAIRAMGEIEGSAGEIGRIIGVIDEIAFQTNLLALNAGIEAARAGDAGRGFAVVAAEVRALAQRCAEAAHEVKGLISESQQRVEQGVDLVGRTGAALRRIIEKVGEIDALVGGIATSAKDQAINLEQVNGALAHMKGAIQQNAAMAQQTKVAVLGLDADAESLASLMGRFGGEDEGSSRPEAAAAA